jgi:hypothetical protein
VLEYVEDHRGPRPDRYQIAPNLVEGEASASGVVEGTASVSNFVGEVIHNRASSGPGASPLLGTAEWLLDRSWPPSGPTAGRLPSLVDRSADVTGPSTWPLSSENVSQGLKQGFELQGGEQVLDDASSAADAAGVVEAREPPPIDPKVLDELERRGLRAKSRPPAKPEQQPRSREEQLAILERSIEDEAKSKSGQEGKESA